MKRTYIFHPLLFAMYAILSPVATNVMYIGLGLIKTLLVALFFVMVVTYLARKFVKHEEKAGLLSTGVIVAFFSYGHTHALLSARLGPTIWLDVILIAMWLLALMGWLYWILHRFHVSITLNNYLNALGLILILFPLYTLLTYSRQTSNLVLLGEEFRNVILQEGGVSDLSGESMQVSVGAHQPDIYYIVLDSYARADVLQEVYGYDNQAFLDALKERGFLVADASLSNYTDTVFSTGATLNMAHVQNAPEFAEAEGGITDLEAFKEMMSGIILTNKVSQFLDEAGYQTVVFDSGYNRLDFATADFHEKSPKIGRFDSQAAFDMMLMDTTLGRVYFSLRGEDYMPLQTQFDNHRERIRYTFENLANYADRDGSFFVYSHVLSPHSPYVFGPNGEALRSDDPFTLMDVSVTEELTPVLYRDQVHYLNSLVLAAIDEIQTKSDPQPIIILQADHGSRSYSLQARADDLRMKLQFHILNAYYLPGADRSEAIYPEITPVNTFRVVLNQYFGTNLPLLADTSYLLEGRQGRLTFVNACKEYNACPKP